MIVVQGFDYRGWLLRSGKIVQNKVNADEALKECPGVEKVVVVKRLESTCLDEGKRSVVERGDGKEDIKPSVNRGDGCGGRSFILYTSGSTGKPKGSFTPQQDISSLCSKP